MTYNLELLKMIGNINAQIGRQRSLLHWRRAVHLYLKVKLWVKGESSFEVFVLNEVLF